jgi:hypothetical protein
LWIIVFDKALTRQLLGKLVAFAKPQQRMLAKAGIEDLVQTAIVKTLDATRTWNHENTALADHLKDVIDSCASIELKHAHKFPALHIEAEQDRDAIEAEVARAMAHLHRSANAMHAGRRRPPRWRTRRDATPVCARCSMRTPPERVRDTK